MRIRLTEGLAISLLFVAPLAWGQNKPTIGVLFKNRVGYWALAEKGALAAGEELGASVVVKGAPSVANPGWQVTLLHSLVEQKFDVLVVSPVKTDVLDAEVKQAAAKGAKIVTFDAPEWEDTVTASVLPDTEGVVESASKTFASFVGDTDEVVIFRNNQGDLPVVRREDAIIQHLKQLKQGLVIRADIYASTDGADPKESAAFVLTKYPQAKAILSTGSAGTMAMFDLLQAKKLAGKVKFMGFGTNLNPKVAQALDDGTMQGWVAQLPYDVGYLCVSTAISVAQGKPVPKVVKEKSLIVTRENLNDPKVQALLKL